MSGQIHHAEGSVPNEKSPLPVHFITGVPLSAQPELARVAAELLEATYPWAADVLRFLGGSLLIGPGDFSLVIRSEASGAMLSAAIPDLASMLDLTTNVSDFEVAGQCH